MTDNLIEAVRFSLDDRMSVWKQGQSTVIATPWSLEDGTPVTLYVTEVDSGIFNVSDAGLAAGALADAGVNLDSSAAGSSFELLKQIAHFSPAIEAGHWDIAVSVAADQLGNAVVELSETVVRTEGLKALARRRPARNFGDRIVKTAAEIGLKIEPRARLPLRYKNATRRVSYRLIGEHRDAYLQSITRAAVTTGYDHARALFADSSISNTRKLTVVESGVQLDEWQYEGLSEVSKVLAELAMPAELVQLAS